MSQDADYTAGQQIEKRGIHGLRTSDMPCPQCGETGHEVALVLGMRSILCPNMPLGEIRAAGETT